MRNDKKTMRVNYNIRRLNRRELPILFVRSSCKHFYAQMFDGDKILFDVSSLNNRDLFASDVKSYNTNGVLALAKVCADKIKSLNISEYVFNRGDREYAGKIKVFGDTVKNLVGGNNE
jgi:ribosomal protein L18